MTTFLVLLRGVNVGGNNRVPMAELKDACAKAGFANVRTYVNSGNAVLEGAGTAESVEAKVEALLAKQFRVQVPVMVRTAQQWARLAGSNPFPESDAKSLHLGVAKAKPKAGAAAELEARATAGEKARTVGEALWIDYNANVARSKLTPAAIDKAVGAPTTLRNWNTVVKLGELAKA